MLNQQEIAENLKKYTYMQKVCQQYITEITLSNITIVVVQNRKSINGLMIHVMNQELEKSMATVKLTDPSLAAKIGWLTIRTGLKVALNAVSMGLGGSLLDGIHDMLGTHGSSIFELNKEMVNVPGSEGKVAVRRPTDWGRTATLQEVGNQFISDYADIVISEANAKTQDEYIKRIKQLFCLEGLDLKKVSHNTALMLYYAPCNTLELAAQEFQNQIYALCIETMQSIQDADKMSTIELLKAVKTKVDTYLPMSYFMELNEAIKEDLQVPREADLRKIFLAEVFSGCSKDILNTKKAFSNDLWKILANAQLIKNIKTTDYTALLEVAEMKMSSQYEKDLKTTKVWEIIIYAQKQNLLGASNAQKFGDSSSLATIILSFNYLDNIKRKAENLEVKLRGLRNWVPKKG